MSNLPGNPHFAEGNNDNGSDNYNLAQATMALAHEQRTANLIALWSMQDETAMSLDKSNGMNVAEWSSVAQQIRERLGL